MEYELDDEGHSEVDREMRRNAAIIGELQRQFHILERFDPLSYSCGLVKKLFSA